MNGQITIDSYLNHTNGIGPDNLMNFTLCVRFNVNFLRPQLSSILSYSTFLEDNTLVIELVSVKSGRQLMLHICKYGDLNHGTCGFYKTENTRIHQDWHHACLSHKSEPIDSDSVLVTTKLYFDGNEVKKGSLFALFKKIT